MATHARGKYEHRGAVEQYRDQFLMCRDLGHHWLPDPHWSITANRGRVSEYRRTLCCSTCGGERTDTYDQHMHPTRRYYHHADGYLLAKEAPKIDRAGARLEQVRRAGINVRKLRVV